MTPFVRLQSVSTIVLALFLAFPCAAAETKPTPTGTPPASPTPTPTKTPQPSCCGEVGPPFASDEDTRPALGYVACCGGVPHACVTGEPENEEWWPPENFGEPDSDERRFIEECIGVHEQSEINDGINCPSYGNGNGGYGSSSEKRKADCKALGAQVECLKGNKSKCKTSKCNEIIDKRIDIDQEEKEKACKSKKCPIFGLFSTSDSCNEDTQDDPDPKVDP